MHCVWKIATIRYGNLDRVIQRIFNAKIRGTKGLSFYKILVKNLNLKLDRVYRSNNLGIFCERHPVPWIIFNILYGSAAFAGEDWKINIPRTRPIRRRDRSRSRDVAGALRGNRRSASCSMAQKQREGRKGSQLSLLSPPLAPDNYPPSLHHLQLAYNPSRSSNSKPFNVAFFLSLHLYFCITKDA